MVGVKTRVAAPIRRASAQFAILRRVREIRSVPMPIGVLIIGSLVRVAIAPFTSWSSDDAPWFHTSLAGYYGLHLYDRPGFSYPPLWGYVLVDVGMLARVVGLGPDFFGVMNADFLTVSSVTGDFSTVVTSPAFNVVFKSVLFGFDVATALLIYYQVRALTRNGAQANLALALWFLNPFVIYESGVHGAADVLVGFSILASLFLVLNDRGYFAGMAWVLGIATKLVPIIIAPQLLLALQDDRISPGSAALTARRFGIFALGAAIGGILVVTPEILFGTFQNMFHNVFARTQESVIIGGFSLSGVRYLRPMSWLLAWAFQNSEVVIRASTIAQACAALAWVGWTAYAIRIDREFALLAGSAGAVATFNLLAPVSNPQYVLWWLPTAIVLIAATRRGYLQLGFISASALVFSLAILGPYAVLSPLATYTHVLQPSTLAANVVIWYTSPGTLWGATKADDFFAPAWLIVVVAVVSLLIIWLRIPSRNAPAGGS